MLVIATSLTVFALLLLVFALRGRIVERGVFCRRCKFNLAGIERTAPGARCPECGRMISKGRPPRRLLRVRSKVVGSLAGLLLLIAIVLAGVSLSGNTPEVFKHMPDRIVVYSAIWGSDPALDELLTRSGRTPSISDGLWDATLGHALVLQANEAVAWDPRWGEVLYIGALNERMSDEQLARYVMTMDRFTFDTRKRVRAGTQKTTLLIRTKSSRGNAISSGPISVQRTLRLTRVELAGHETQLNPRGSGLALPFPVRSMGAGMTKSLLMSRHIDLTSDGAEPVAGETLPIAIEYTITLTREGQDSSFHEYHGRIERKIEIVPHDTEIVSRTKPMAGSAGEFARKFGIPDIGVTDPMATQSRMNKLDALIIFNMKLEPRDLPIAYRVIFRSDAGEEYEIDTIVDGPASNTSHFGYMVNASGLDEQEHGRLLRAAQIMLDQGHATLIFRTSPDLAADTPTIDEVLDLDLIFERIPVIASPPGQFSNTSIIRYADGSDNTISARVLDEERASTPGAGQPYNTP